MSTPPTPDLATARTVWLALLVSAVAVMTWPTHATATPTAPTVASVDVRLSADGPAVGEVVEVATRHAVALDADLDPVPALRVVVVDDLPADLRGDRVLLGGVQTGSSAWVRSTVGWPERTLLHEVTHVLVREAGHGPRWRDTYLSAFRELFGPEAAARERRRLAWVHDRCYVDRSCRSG